MGRRGYPQNAGILVVIVVSGIIGGTYMLHQIITLNNFFIIIPLNYTYKEIYLTSALNIHTTKVWNKFHKG